MRRDLVTLVMASVFAVSNSASASVVHFDPAGNATDISFLIIDNTSYDVTFAFGLYEDLYPSLRSPFDFGGTARAIQAIASVLNASDAQTAGPAAGPYNDHYIFVPGSLVPGGAATAVSWRRFRAATMRASAISAWDLV